MGFSDNDFPVVSGGQAVAWNPLEWLRKRLGNQPEQYGPSENLLPRPDTIRDNMRKRQQLMDDLLRG